MAVADSGRVLTTMYLGVEYCVSFKPTNRTLRMKFESDASVDA